MNLVNNKKKIILFLSLFFIGLNVYAVDIPACTDSELTRLKELANNVKFEKKYNIEEDTEDNVNVFYNVNVINYDSDIRISYKDTISDEDDDDEAISINPNEGVPTIFFEGSSVKFYIYSYTENLCTGRLLKTVTIKFPIYNDYYYFNKEKCQDNLNFKYCKEYMDVSEVEFSKIEQEFKEYIEKNNVNNETNSNNTYLYIIIGGIIGIVVIISVVGIVIRNHKRGDL